MIRCIQGVFWNLDFLDPNFDVDPPLGGRFTWGPKSQVSLMLASPNMEAKSQLLSLKKSLRLDYIQ